MNCLLWHLSHVSHRAFPASPFHTGSPGKRPRSGPVVCLHVADDSETNATDMNDKSLWDQETSKWRSRSLTVQILWLVQMSSSLWRWWRLSVLSQTEIRLINLTRGLLSADKLQRILSAGDTAADLCPNSWTTSCSCTAETESQNRHISEGRPRVPRLATCLRTHEEELRLVRLHLK